MLGEDDEESAARKSSLKGLLKAFKGTRNGKVHVVENHLF